jgi:tryptophan-rich sensory protein
MTRNRSILGLAGFLILSLAAGAIGGLWSAPNTQPGAWYYQIEKPSWTPPSWLFGPVWTTLYVMMAVAAWLVWKRGGWAANRGALTLYLIQLILNTIWSGLFFGLRSPGLALAEIVALWIFILLTLFAFWRVARPAGLLLVPYILWVSFAAALTFAIWRLNG